MKYTLVDYIYIGGGDLRMYGHGFIYMDLLFICNIQ